MKFDLIDTVSLAIEAVQLRRVFIGSQTFGDPDLTARRTAKRVPRMTLRGCQVFRQPVDQSLIAFECIRNP